MYEGLDISDRRITEDFGLSYSAVPGGAGITWELFNENMPRKLDGCFKLLGAPIGTADY